MGDTGAQVDAKQEQHLASAAARTTAAKAAAAGAVEEVAPFGLRLRPPSR
jgi:hypothetical protein